MSEQQNIPIAEEEKKSVFGVIVHSFFVVPFLLAVFSVLLFASVRILTMESRTVHDYLEDVKVGGIPKRWQSAFELSKILANPKSVPLDAQFTTELIRVFEKSIGDDDRVRQYLALAMARTGNQEFVPTLVKSASNEKDQNLTAFVYALGILKNNQATDVLLPYLKSDDARIRLVTTMALGNIGGTKVLNSIKELLNDLEPNVQWEAAVALAKNNDDSANELLLKLMDRNYLSQFSNVDQEEQAHVMLVAIDSSVNLINDQIATRLEELFKTDQNMKIRNAAFAALEKYKKSS